MSKIGENIKKFRVSKGLTQDQLAQLLGYKSKSAVSNWENGANSPSDDKIEMMINIFGIDANTLFGWTNAAQIKSDAEDLANMILVDDKVKGLVNSLKNMSQEDMSMVISFANRLKGDVRNDDN